MSRDGRSSTAQRLQLVAVGGPTVGPFVLDTQQSARLGRAVDCDFVLPDLSVSRHHATIVHRGGQWFIADRESRHGTFLNGTRVAAATPAALSNGDVLRLGAHTFWVGTGDGVARAVATTDESAAAANVSVERVPRREIDSLAQRRLDLLLNGAAAIHEANDEPALIDAVLQLAQAGTGFQHAAMLRSTGTVEQVEVMGVRGSARDGEEFTFSRSLVREASDGHVARLSRQETPFVGQSIAQLGIAEALCAPIVLDNAVAGYLYLDTRDQSREVQGDAAGFSHAVSRLAALALANLKRTKLEQRQKQLEADLNAAHKAQAFLCPPKHGKVGPLEYAYEMRPGRMVAGDLFDVFPVGDGRIGICCGDVTGQGMAAAILMTAVLSHARATLDRYLDPARAVTEVNRFIVNRSADNVFVSLWLGLFDPTTRELSYVDAGHGHWLLRRDGEPPAYVPHEAGGLLVGVLDDAAYTAAPIDLNPGDRIILFSDGIIEHLDESGETFGNDRLIRALAGTCNSAEELSQVFAALERHVGRSTLADDTTLASIELATRGA